MIKLKLLILIIMISTLYVQEKHSLKVTGGNFVTVDGVQFHYRKGGRGPYLLLLHGFTLSSDQWTEYFDKFAEQYTVIALDFPGHGKSERTGKEFNFDHWTQLTIKALEKLQIKQVKAIGHSYGAITLMSIARQQPDLIKAMVLISGAHRLDSTMQAILLEDSFEKADVDLQNFYRKIHRDNMEQIQGIFSDIRKFAENSSPLIREQLGEIDLPILLIFGDRDSFYSMETIAEMYNALPNAQLWVIPEQGHAPVWQFMGADELTHQVFSKKVRQFLKHSNHVKIK
ncbi:alpha/beta fold hydrolase [Flexithrix dorotheae]|uniref:alpha/beta fold hydrolase n=1 Tax=Flexithrix dorotheae TaxID=70993 RepID=UPI00039FD2EA|nr:alpha/beta hydrolase [Flexithrix dorotheae]